MTEPSGIFISETPVVTTIVHRRYVPQRMSLVVQFFLALVSVLVFTVAASAYLMSDLANWEVYGLWSCVVAVSGVLTWLRFAKTTITADANEICLRLDALVHYKTTRMSTSEICEIRQEHDSDLGDDGSCLCFVLSQGWRVRCLHYLPYATTDWAGRKLAEVTKLPYAGSAANGDGT